MTSYRPEIPCPPAGAGRHAPTERETSPVEAQRGTDPGLDSDGFRPHSDAPFGTTRDREDNQERGRKVYIFITLLLALMISGFGAGFAFACRMQPDENRD